MRNLEKHIFNPSNARKEWQEYENFLFSHIELKEQNDVLPFFKQRHNLSVLIGTYFPQITTLDCYAHEFCLSGSFRPDLIVGDSTSHHYLLVEFENGTPYSIFTKTKNWATRFEKAHSQLVDWLWKLDDMKSTSDFQTTFGSRDASFHCLIVIGKGMNLEIQEKNRLIWRTQKTIINSISIQIVSFEQLLSDCDKWLKRYYGV
jgi:hypothetical protein